MFTDTEKQHPNFDLTNNAETTKDKRFPFFLTWIEGSQKADYRVNDFDKDSVRRTEYKLYDRGLVSYTHLDVYKRQV